MYLILYGHKYAFIWNCTCFSAFQIDVMLMMIKKC